MTTEADDPIGGAWLALAHGLELVAPLAVSSRVGGRRATHVGPATTVETYIDAMRPAATLRGHLMTVGCAASCPAATFSRPWCTIRPWTCGPVETGDNTLLARIGPFVPLLSCPL